MSSSSVFAAFLVCTLALLANAKDPATGWMAYAVGSIPDGAQRITRLEMTWKVGAEPRRSSVPSPCLLSERQRILFLINRTKRKFLATF